MSTLASVTPYTVQIGTAAGSISVTPGVALPAGQSIVVAIGVHSGTTVSVSSVTDSAGNTYVQRGPGVQSGSNSRADLWDCLNPATGLTNVQSITATFTGGTATASMTVMAHSVQLTADGSGTATGLAAAASPAARTVTTTQANDWVVGVLDTPSQNTVTLQTSGAASPSVGRDFFFGAQILMGSTNTHSVAWTYPTATGTYGPRWTQATSSATGGVTMAYTLPAGAVAAERMYPGTIGVLAPANDSSGPYLRYDAYQFAVAGQILGVTCYAFAGAGGGPTAGQTITCTIKSNTGTTLGSGTVLATGAAGELTVTFGTPVAVAASTTYRVYIDDTATAAFRVAFLSGGSTSSATQWDITRQAGGSAPVANNLYYADPIFWPATAGASTDANLAVTAATTAAGTVGRSTGAALTVTAATTATGVVGKSTSAALTVTAAPSSRGTASVPTPARAAFYYPWFTGAGDAGYPGAWTQAGVSPWTQYHPKRGYYDSTTTAVIDAHIGDMVHAGFQVGITSWWGQGSREDTAVSNLLARAAASGTGFKWAVYYEAEGNTIAGVTGSPSPASSQITADLNYITTNYTSHPNYLHVNGKPVIFVYGGPEDDSGNTPTITNRPAARWSAAKAAANESWYTVLKVYDVWATDNATYPSDGWHQYGPATAVDQQSTYSYTISPGFWRGDETTPRLARLSRAAWQANIRSMLASGTAFQLVTSYNEWGEGHAVEDASGPSIADTGTNTARTYSGTGWDSPSGYGTYLDDLASGGARADNPSLAVSAATTASGSVSSGSLTGTAGLTVTAATSAAGVTSVTGAASLTVTGAASATGVAGYQQPASLTVGVSTTAAGTVATSSTAALTVTTAGAGSGAVATSISGALTVTAATSASGNVATSTAAALTVNAAPIGSGVSTGSNNANLAVTATASASGVAAYQQGAARPVTAVTTAAGLVATSSGAALTVAGTPTGSGSAGKASTTTAGVTVALTASGTVGSPTGAALTVTAGTSAAGFVATSTGAALQVAAGTSAAGTVTVAYTGAAGVTLTAGTTATGVSSGQYQPVPPFTVTLTSAPQVQVTTSSAPAVTATLTSRPQVTVILS